MTIRYLILSLTTRCNLKCRYCYNGDNGETEEMPHAIVKQAISIAAESNQPFHLQLTGGEPTLAPKLIEFAARSAKQTGFCHGMGIQTNGTRLTTDLLTLFKMNQLLNGILYSVRRAVVRKILAN